MARDVAVRTWEKLPPPKIAAPTSVDGACPDTAQRHPHTRPCKNQIPFSAVGCNGTEITTESTMYATRKAMYIGKGCSVYSWARNDVYKGGGKNESIHEGSGMVYNIDR